MNQPVPNTVDSSTSSTSSSSSSSSTTNPTTNPTTNIVQEDEKQKKLNLKISRLNTILSTFKLRDSSNKPSKEIFTETNYLLKNDLIINLLNDINNKIDDIKIKYDEYKKNLISNIPITVIDSSLSFTSSSSSSSNSFSSFPSSLSSTKSFLNNFDILEWSVIQKSADIVFFALYQTQSTVNEINLIRKVLRNISNLVVYINNSENSTTFSSSIGNSTSNINQSSFSNEDIYPIPSSYDDLNLLHHLYRLQVTLQFIHIAAHQQTTPLFNRESDDANDLDLLDTFNDLNTDIDIDKHYDLTEKWNCNGTKAVAAMTYAIFRQPAVDEEGFNSSPQEVEWFLFQACCLRGYNYIRCCILPIILIEKSFFDHEKALFYFCILSDLLANLAKIFCMSHYKQFHGNDNINFPLQFFPPTHDVFIDEIQIYKEISEKFHHDNLIGKFSTKSNINSIDRIDCLTDVLGLFNELFVLYPPFSTMFWRETADSSNAFDLTGDADITNTIMEEVGSFHPFVMRIVEISKNNSSLFFTTLQLLTSLGQGPNGSTSLRVYLFLDQAKASLQKFNWVTLFNRLDILIRNINGGEFDHSNASVPRPYSSAALQFAAGAPNPVSTTSFLTSSTQAGTNLSITTTKSTLLIRFTPVDLYGLGIVLDLLYSCVLSPKIAEDIYKKHRIIPRLFSIISCAFPIHIKSKAMNVLGVYAKHGSKHFLDDIWNHLEIYQMFPIGYNSLNLRGISCELEEVEAELGYYPLTNSVLTLLSNLFKHGIPSYLGLGYRIPGVIHYLEFVIEKVFYMAHERYYANESTAQAEKWRLTAKAMEVLTTILKSYELKNISLKDGIEFVSNPSNFLTNDQQNLLLHNKQGTLTSSTVPPTASSFSNTNNSTSLPSSTLNSSVTSSATSSSSSSNNTSFSNTFSDSDLIILQDFLNPTSVYPISGPSTQLNPSGYSNWEGMAPKDPAYHILALFFGNTRLTMTIMNFIETLSKQYMEEQREIYIKNELQAVLDIVKLAYSSDHKKSSHRNIKKMYSSFSTSSSSSYNDNSNGASFLFHSEPYDVSNENHEHCIDSIFWIERALGSLLIFLYEVSTLNTKFLTFTSISYRPVKIQKFENEKIIELSLSLTNFPNLIGGYNIGAQLCSYITTTMHTCPALPSIGVISVSILQRLLMESPSFSVINSSDEQLVCKVVQTFAQALLSCSDEEDLNGIPLQYHTLYYSKTGEYFSQFYGGERSPLKCTVEAKQWEEKFNNPYDINEKSNEIKAQVYTSHASSNSIRSVREAILQFLISTLSKNWSFPLVLLGFDSTSSLDSSNLSPKRLSLGSQPDCFEAIVHLLTPYLGRQWLNYSPSHALLAYELIYCLVQHPLVQASTLYRLSELDYFKTQLPFLINLFIHEKWEASESTFVAESILSTTINSSSYESKCDYLTCLAHSLSWTLQASSILIAGHLTRPRASPYLATTTRQILRLLFGMAHGKSHLTSTNPSNSFGISSSTSNSLIKNNIMNNTSGLLSSNQSYPLSNLALLASTSSTLSSGASHTILSECLRKIVKDLPAALFDEYYAENYINTDKKSPVIDPIITTQIIQESRANSCHYLRPGRSNPNLFTSDNKSSLRPPVYSCIDVTEFIGNVIDHMPSDISETIINSFSSTSQIEDNLSSFSSNNTANNSLVLSLNKLVSSLILENQQSRVRSSSTHLIMVIRQIIDLVCLVPNITAQICDTTSNNTDLSIPMSSSIGLDYSPTMLLGELLLPLSHTLLACSQSNPLGLPLDQFARGVNSLVNLVLKLASSSSNFEVPSNSNFENQDELEIFYDGIAELMIILMRVLLLTPSLSSVSTSSSSFHLSSSSYISSISQPEAYVSYKGSLLSSLERIFLFALKNTRGNKKFDLNFNLMSILLDTLANNLDLLRDFSYECLNLTIFFPNTLWKCISIDTLGSIFNLIHQELSQVHILMEGNPNTDDIIPLVYRRTDLWMALCQSLISNDSLLNSIINYISPLPSSSNSNTSTPPSLELYCSLLQFFTHMFSYSSPHFSTSTSFLPFNSSLFINSHSTSLPFPSVFSQIVSKAGLLDRVLLAEHLVKPLFSTSQTLQGQNYHLPLQLSLNLFTLCLNFETTLSSFLSPTSSTSFANGKVLHSSCLFYKKHYLYISHFIRETISNINSPQASIETNSSTSSIIGDKNSLILSFIRFLSALTYTNLNFNLIKEKEEKRNDELLNNNKDENKKKEEKLSNFINVSPEFLTLLETSGGEAIINDLFSTLQLLTFSPLPRSILQSIPSQDNNNLKTILSNNFLTSSSLLFSSFSSSNSISLAWKELENGTIGPYLYLVEGISIMLSLLSHREDTILFLRPSQFQILAHSLEQIIKIYISSSSSLSSTFSSSSSTSTPSSALVIKNSSNSSSSTQFSLSPSASSLILRIAETLATTLHNFILFYNKKSEKLNLEGLNHLEMILNTLTFLPKSSYLSILGNWIRENGLN